MTWQVPQDPNGIIQGYIVTWKKVINDRDENDESALERRTTEGNVTSFTIRGLGELAYVLICCCLCQFNGYNKLSWSSVTTKPAKTSNKFYASK